MDKGVRAFMVSRRVDTNDYGDLFSPAKKKLGLLRDDEMYGFKPALVLGGPETLEHLEKVKIVEHLMFLSQISDLQPYSFTGI
ncbi:hypothetical protein D3C78_1619060 [compost metagenome]